MESRKITIVQTKNQKKSVIQSSATTLGELKNDLRRNGIDYDEMAFYEGLTKTELKTDDSLLPHDVERNGTTTNELVFMLTNTQKKIKSGMMTRSEAYSYIKEHNLQDSCKKKFGRNFTMCKTDDLISLVNSFNKTKKTESTKADIKKESVATEAPQSNEPCSCVDKQARSAIGHLVDILYYYDVISESDGERIICLLDSSCSEKDSSDKQDSPYSQSEIDDMFRGMC